MSESCRETTNTSSGSVPHDILEKWQRLVDVMADVIDVPVGLIMRISGPHIEVFTASQAEGNPYSPGDSEIVCGSGLYCETVIRSCDKLLVPNALDDPDWENNPDLKLGLISYLGFPILLPTGEVFGTLCVLDNKTNAYTSKAERFMVQLKEVIECHLALLDTNRNLSEANRQLTSSLAEINTLRGILPICSHCKSIRDDKGYWQSVEAYLSSNTEADLSHGICPYCLQENYPELAEDIIAQTGEHKS